MVKIGEQVKGCRYWGYEPASGELRYAISKIGRERCRELRQQYRDERETIKSAGFKLTAYGMNKQAVIEVAERIEKATGIAMRVFSHDYL